MNNTNHTQKLTNEVKMRYPIHRYKDVSQDQYEFASVLQPYYQEIDAIALQHHQFISVITPEFLVFVLFDHQRERWCIGPFLISTVEMANKKLNFSDLSALESLKQVNINQIKTIASFIISFVKGDVDDFEQINLGENLDLFLEDQRVVTPRHTSIHISETLISQLKDLMITGNVYEVRSFVSHFDMVALENIIHGHSLRSIKNHIISNISRCSFIAMNEGLDYAHMMKEADEYVSRLETYYTYQDSVNVLKEATIRFTQLIYDFKQGQYSKYTKYVIKKIYSNYNQNLTLAGFANELKISSSHLSRILSSDTQQSFHDLLNSYRVEKAKELLKEPQNNIATVAHHCGFLYQNHFTQVFKKHTGMTPKEYVKSVAPVLHMNPQH